MITPELNVAPHKDYLPVAVAMVAFSTGTRAAQISERFGAQLAIETDSISDTNTGKNVESAFFITPLIMKKTTNLQKNNKHNNTHKTPAQIASAEITPAVFNAWDRVHDCEEPGNWRVIGPIFSGGLGMTNRNWIALHGTEFAPNAGEATPDEQIVIARRLQKDPPDQDGCNPGGW
jgi:hypothetical protein